MNKRILDSVHGYISISDDLCENIIDNVYFQRLRRIEQTSGRSLFPCARHDRFIHSLGVYHLGCKIVDSIRKRYENQFTDHDTKVYDSYIVACLLHDVGHSPFSHTFEDYYKLGNPLKARLCETVDDEDFQEDLEQCLSKCAPHEMMSAYIAIKQFGTWIKQNTKADLSLIARMIVGCKYFNNKDFSFENAFIDLIHGDIIDADGLDYACRDAWASGYYTSNIDVDRLIDSIRIEKNAGGLYVVCYTAKALNEIEAVLNVKSFQQSNVITHHTVVYEQELLVEAMKSTAVYHIFGEENCDDVDKRDKALMKLCNLDSFFSPMKLEHSGSMILYPMDDDFVSLMKYIPNDKYVHQWLTRQYALKPLWKSKADFYNIFDILIGKTYSKDNWLFSDYAKEFISQKFNIDISSIWIIAATSKYKQNLAGKVNLYVGGNIKLYTNLFVKDKNSFTPNVNPFYYIYVPVESDTNEIIKALKEQVNLYIFNVD